MNHSKLLGLKIYLVTLSYLDFFLYNWKQNQPFQTTSRERNTIVKVSLSSRKNAKNAQSFKVPLGGSKTESDKYELAYFNIQSTQSNYGDGNKEFQSFKLYSLYFENKCRTL